MDSEIESPEIETPDRPDRERRDAPRRGLEPDLAVRLVATILVPVLAVSGTYLAALDGRYWLATALLIGGFALTVFVAQGSERAIRPVMWLLWLPWLLVCLGLSFIALMQRVAG